MIPKNGYRFSGEIMLTQIVDGAVCALKDNA